MAETIEQLRADRNRFREFWLRASEERDALAEKLTELDELLEQARDSRDAAWENADAWQEWSEAAEAELEAERKERDALIRIEVERLSGRAPKRRGRPPSWSADAETEVARMSAEGLSVRQIAADLGTSKSQVQRVIARVRRGQAEAAERARLVALASGRSVEQRAARVAEHAAKSRPIQEYDSVRVDRWRDRLQNLPVE